MPQFLPSHPSSLSFSVVSAGSDDGTVRLWEVATSRCLRQWEFGTEIVRIAWNPNPELPLLAVAAGSTMHVSDFILLLLLHTLFLSVLFCGRAFAYGYAMCMWASCTEWSIISDCGVVFALSL